MHRCRMVEERVMTVLTQATCSEHPYMFLWRMLRMQGPDRVLPGPFPKGVVAVNRLKA